MCELFTKWSVVFVATSCAASLLTPVVGGAIFYYIQDGYVDTGKLYLAMNMKYVVASMGPEGSFKF